MIATAPAQANETITYVGQNVVVLLDASGHVATVWDQQHWARAAEMLDQNKYNALRQTLLTWWDPIGIRDVPAAQDEYDSFVRSILSRFSGDTPVEKLDDYFLQVEAEIMGLVPDRRRSRMVAKPVLDLLSQE